MSREEYKITPRAVEHSREFGGSYDNLIKAKEEVQKYRERLREVSQEERK